MNDVDANTTDRCMTVRDISTTRIDPLRRSTVEIERSCQLNEHSIVGYAMDVLMSVVPFDVARLALMWYNNNFLRFWWSQELDELKEKVIDSCRLWKDVGKPIEMVRYMI